MTRRLFMTAVTALSIAAFCLLTANWLFSTGKVSFNDIQLCSNDGSGVFTFQSGNIVLGSPSKHALKTVQLPWEGGDTVTIDIPAKVTFEPGDQTGATLIGDPDAVKHVTLRNGLLASDHGFNCASTHGLEVRFTGKPVSNWALNGSGDLVLNRVSQEKIQLSLTGSGTITADGTVDDLELNIAGSGDADLGQLTVKRATAKLLGSGDAELDPLEQADISIAGSGDVRLHNQPPKLDSHVTGSGEISEAL